MIATAIFGICNFKTGWLDFNPKQKVDAALDRVYDYRPVSCDKLKEENTLLYIRLKVEGIYSIKFIIDYYIVVERNSTKYQR